MAQSQAMTQTVRISQPIKLLRSMLRLVWALFVFVGVCLAWLLLFLLFLPFIVVAEIINFAKVRKAGTTESLPKARVQIRSEPAVPLVFDRRNDVSKLFGCNTRGVRYRWSLFGNRLEFLLKEFEHPKAVDFGAGSLRDSYELAKLGFEVVSVDLNERVLTTYSESYDWTTVGIKPKLHTSSLEDLVKANQSTPVQLVLAFDVIEHLEDPASYVKALSELLCARGFLFTIVPNRRSLFERYFKYSIAQQRKRGVVPEPGVPHLQFRSPEEWNEFFQSNGFRVIEHDMTIGHLVNDWWNGLLSIPLRLFVNPVLEVIALRTKFNLDTSKLESTLCSPWLMERVNVLDMLLKKQFNSRFGWNLIVAQKSFD